MKTFQSFALSPKMVETLKALGYKNPTPIQELVIPKALKGESLLATSETGSGKTHAFLIPILDRIDMNKDETQALILSPTRELAYQTFMFLKEFLAYYPSLTIRLLASGEEKNKMLGKNKKDAQIVIATPGRLHDLTFDENAFNVMTAKYVVLDEADMLTEMGFLKEIDDILVRLDQPSIFVFSATIADNFVPFLEKYIHPEHRIFLSKEGKNPNRIQHFAVDTKHQKDIDALVSLLSIIQPYLCLVFCSTKSKVDEIYQGLIQRNIQAGILHGDLSARERKQMMRRILQNDFSIIVCSDMAARGLDLEGVSDVINMDLPQDMAFYFHRAGRTGRYNLEGNCYTFYDQDHVDRIERLLSSGVSLKYLSLKNDVLKEESSVSKKKKKRKVNTELEKEIQKAISQTKTKKVKPGYKKKVKVAVEKAKKRHKRKIIREDIRRQRVERYKKEARGE